MPFKIKNLRLSKIDLCKEGTNPDSHILLTKSKEGGQDGNINKDKNNKEGGENMKLKDILKGLSEDKQEFLNGLVEKLNKSEEKKEKLEKRIEKLEKSNNEPDNNPQDDFEGMKKEILKKADDKTKTYIEKLEKSLKDEKTDKDSIKKDLSNVKSTLKKAKYVDIAKKEYNDIPVKNDEFGEILMKMSDVLEKETFEKVQEIFKKVNNSLKESEIFNEQGSNAESDEDNTSSRIKTGIEKIRKSNPDMSKEKAIAKYLKQNPEDYDKFEEVKGV